MSLQVLGPKPYFWQWDTGQKLVVDNRDCGEVHFDNGTTDNALVVQIKSDQDGNRVAEVPNILLQTAKPLRAYLFQETENGAMTSTLYTFQVIPRLKPEDYVYTETEVLAYSNIDKRVRALEEGLDEQAAIAVQEYIAKNPDAVSGLPRITEESEGKYLQVKNGVAVWGDLEIPQQYGLVTYDQTKTITIT